MKGAKGAPKAECNNRLKSQDLDLELLDKLSEEYILLPNSLQDIDRVEKHNSKRRRNKIPDKNWENINYNKRSF